jgi:uncharacterized protein (TIGR02001 family)
MRKSILGLSAVSLLALATPALAQDEAASEWKITGSATLVSDYRFRGFSQSGENAAVQAGININHESGFYVGTWGSSISFNGNAEIDIFAGYTKEVAPGITADVGLLYYLYPKKGGGDTDFFEPYVNLTGAVGPATIKVGVNYAWAQNALASLDDGSKVSAIYLHAEPSIAVPGTPLTLDGHVGYAVSDAFPGGFGADHHVWDYAIGGSVAVKNLSLGIHYVTTDEARYRTAPLTGLGAEDIGADGAVVFNLTASF